MLSPLKTITVIFPLALLLAAPARAQDPAPSAAQADVPPSEPADVARAPGVLELRRRATQAFAGKDYAAYRQALLGLHRLRPNNDRYMYQLVVASALLNDRSGAYTMMLQMQQQGLAADFDESDATESIRGTEVYTYVNDLLKLAGEPAGEAELLFRLPEAVKFATSIAWDPGRESFLVATAGAGAVIAVDREGQSGELLRANEDNGLWAIFGLLVDAGRNRLWVSSSPDANPEGGDPSEAGRSELFEFALDTLSLIKRYPVPADGRPHRLGGLAQTPAGDLFAVDTMFPIIYHLAPGEERLKPFVASKNMVSMRGIALSDDGRMLYVADYELGVLALDLEERKSAKLAGPATLNLGGIEGLEYWDGHLVVIQNGIKPQRVMRLKLSDDGLSVSDVAPLAVAQEFFSYPNFGVMLGDELYFLANSHWVRSQDELQAIGLARTRVSAPPDLAPPDLQKFWDKFERPPEEKAGTTEP